jgi:hypothetical protein
MKNLKKSTSNVGELASLICKVNEGLAVETVIEVLETLVRVESTERIVKQTRAELAKPLSHLAMLSEKMAGAFKGGVL